MSVLFENFYDFSDLFVVEAPKLTGNLLHLGQLVLREVHDRDDQVCHQLNALRDHFLYIAVPTHLVQSGLLFFVFEQLLHH